MLKARRSSGEHLVQSLYFTDKRSQVQRACVICSSGPEKSALYEWGWDSALGYPAPNSAFFSALLYDIKSFLICKIVKKLGQYIIREMQIYFEI